MQHDGESSVEEILESIKKVIARDNRDEAMVRRRRRSEEGVAEVAPEPADADEAEEVLELGEAEIVEDDFDEAPESAGFDGEGDVDDSADTSDAPLIGDTVRESMRENFAALSMLSEPSARPQIVRSGETSLEGLTRELLRPMLAEWLDANLPDMVERMVKTEIARIAGKRD